MSKVSKIKVSTNVWIALEYAKNNNKVQDIIAKTIRKEWDSNNFMVSVLNKTNWKLICKAVLFGYEQEKTTEESVKQCYNNPWVTNKTMSVADAYRLGMRDMAKYNMIDYVWMSKTQDPVNLVEKEVSEQNEQ